LAKPAAPLSWSTDTNFSAGPETGTPTKEDPAGVASQGWVAGRAAPAKWMNWILNLVGSWTGYLDNLHNESDFLGQQYVWTNYHQWDNPVTFVGTAEFQDSTVFSGAVTFDVGFDAAGFIANPGDIGLGAATNEVVYTDAVGLLTPRARTVLVNMANGTCDNALGTPTAVFAASLLGWEFLTAAGKVNFPIEVPRGSALQTCRVGVYNPTGGTLDFSANVFGLVPNKTTPGSPGGASIDSTGTLSVATTASAVYTLDLSAVTAVDNSIASYYLEVSGQLGGKIMWVEVTYLDPGPRNG
jgi:hypothetical protein